MRRTRADEVFAMSSFTTEKTIIIKKIIKKIYKYGFNII